MLFTFLLIVHALIAAMLVTVILMQKSEGGGLGMGGGPSGLMTARGAADFLTRATSVLAVLFVLMAFTLATLASLRARPGEIDTSLAHRAAPAPITAPSPTTPISGIPMMGSGAVLPGPDGATSQALQPASAGPPAPANAPERPTPAQLHAQAEADHRAAAAERAPAVIPPAKVFAQDKGKLTVGINGVHTAPAAIHKAAAPAPAASEASPAAGNASIPTVSAPPPPPAGHSTPQP